MKHTYLNLSKKIDKKQISVIKNLHKTITATQIPYFIVGAFARDLIMEYGYSIRTPRITLDKDIAIQIATWQEFSELKDALQKNLNFMPDVNSHRMRSDKYGIVDIIPFGNVQKGKIISLPPENDFEINVLGFQEAYEYAIRVRLDGCIIPICSLPGFVILKLIAMTDRNHLNKDADDIAFVIKNYLEAGNNEKLYTDAYKDLLDEPNFDYELASAKMLGRDMGKILTNETGSYLLMELDHIIKKGAGNLILALERLNIGRVDRFRFAKDLIAALKNGIEKALAT